MNKINGKFYSRRNEIGIQKIYKKMLIFPQHIRIRRLLNILITHWNRKDIQLERMKNLMRSVDLLQKN